MKLTGHQNGVVPAEEIDRYVDALAEPRRAALARLRQMIVDILPGAGQGISCGVPAFRAGGKTIAGFAALKNRLGYLPHSGSVFPQRRDELGGYPLWSGAVRFSIGEPRPAPLAGKLVAVRLAQAFPGWGDRAQAGPGSQEEGSMPDRNQPPRQGTPVAGSGRAALDTALAYYRAWTSHDFGKAMTYVAGDIVCQAPAGRLEGAAAFRGFMGPFVQIVTSSSLIAAFGDDEKAVVMYDTGTVPVTDAPGAECVTVRDGKITHMRIIFDRLPFDEARRAAATG